jgi:Putative transposase/Transposase zinc-binding domain
MCEIFPCHGHHEPKEPSVPQSTVEPAARPALTIGEVLRLAVPLHAQQFKMPRQHWKTLEQLMRCRTPEMGGYTYHCQDCGKEHFVPLSCRNRHCPTCQPLLGHDWMEKEAALLLPVPYFHTVFTLPHSLNSLIAQNQAALYKLLFAAAAETLLEFGKQRLGGQIGITMVLHTWGQNLSDHYHVHAIVTGGALSKDGVTFKKAPAHYLFPIKAMSKMFRGKYRDGLYKLYEKGELEFHGKQAEYSQPAAFAAQVQTSVKQPWIVYAKAPFAGPAQMLAYLARYTHRVGISNSRLISQAEDGGVTFGWKDYADDSKSKVMTLSAVEFVRRFRSHILPPGFVKIRHYGLLSTRNRKIKIAKARSLLGAKEAVLAEAGAEPSRTDKPAKAQKERLCPYCQSPRLTRVESSKVRGKERLKYDKATQEPQEPTKPNNERKDTT